MPKHSYNVKVTEITVNLKCFLGSISHKRQLTDTITIKTAGQRHNNC